MKISVTEWTLFFISWILCFTGGAILRPYRQNVLARAKMRPTTFGPRDPRRFKMQSLATIGFQPTPRRCCHIGERVAKKKKICDITVLAVVRKYERDKYSPVVSNRSAKHFKRSRLSKLSEKVSKCSAVYPNHFVKCCKYKKEFYNHLRKCHTKPRRQRRRCKKNVRRRYS
ncbi:uncharacterized protein LOC101845821 [Aplysia californica]|uniref:Uncharacterized protein LOC101845821 n=1 Tax=Aplysia californica TaxID=6500 RepID=A0ABM0KA52_APLCA|nr:uncharacterized protein LOC101845821 [Aplysia californica]